MSFVDLLGAALTLVALGFLALGGTLAALVLLGRDADRDPLALAIASLLLATAEAVAVGLALGALGILRFPIALAVQAGLVVLLSHHLRQNSSARALAAPLAVLGRRAWATLCRYPALALITAHAGGSEALRGLLRPPLSWDSMMYHLVLTATWLQEGNLFPVLGNIPVNYYGYAPANGSVWFWWWMAPSHSELWVNLAPVPHWVLFGLATGAVARELGARRHWPVAMFLVLVTPTVVRFAATPYVDIFLGAVLVAACFFALRWLAQPTWAAALLAGTGLGLAAGTKVLGAVYAVALAGAVVALARGNWPQRARQLAAAMLCAALFGGYFYLRNLALGADPLALPCEMTASGPENANLPTFPRKNSVLALANEMFEQGKLVRVFLGITRPQSLELGVGPPALVFLGIALVLPFALGRERRRVGLLVAAQIWLQAVFWLSVPFAANNHVFANVRYLLPALALTCAGGVALAEVRGMSRRWLLAIALVFALQGLLQLHAEMPTEVRILLVLIDLALVLLALLPKLRTAVAGRQSVCAALGILVALACVPWLARFRVADRTRALESEFTAHATGARFFARAWGFLADHGATGTVATVGAPNSYFLYPGMGTHLERKVRYVNINRANLPLAIAYQRCEPRVDPDPSAWLENLAEADASWVHVSRYPEFPFPLEDEWAAARPSRFALRYEDPLNRIYEITDVGPAPSPGTI